MSALLVGLVTLAAGVSVLSAAGLVTYHGYRGASIASAIDMAIHDYRVAVKCPADLDLVVDFVSRTPLESGEVRLVETLGSDWVEGVCGGEFQTLPEIEDN